ncbi:hypothetical protein CI741_02290, partial [Klebsiella pneumoniae subsp. pneumoniae]
GTVCVVGKIRDLILQLSKSSIYSTKPREAEIAAKKLTTDTVSIHISQDETVPLISLGLRNN